SVRKEDRSGAPAGGSSRRAAAVQRACPGALRDRWSPAALDQGFLSISECVCPSLSLLFQSVNVRSRSLVSGNDLTQQTGSSGQTETSSGEKEEEEDRHRLLLPANSLYTSLVSPSTCFHQGDSL
ncbi:hypothetical protein GOODEAATRI_004622, partial [Goodea atripinnis]